MIGLEFYNQVRTVPDDAKKTIKGGRMSGMTDINPMWRIKVLTEQFGPCGIGWYYIPVKKWLEHSGNEIAAFVDIELYVKVGEEWSKPIAGTGGSSFAAKQSAGIYVSDECYKMATTDAISVACKQLGIGADVYWSADKTKYDNRQEQGGKSNNALKKSDTPQITEAHINTLYNELGRTGIGWKSLCKNYGVDSFSVLTMEQFKDAMDTLKAKPDKPLDPDKIPPENLGELPWETIEG